jgi:hypothetical protein
MGQENDADVRDQRRPGVTWLLGLVDGALLGVPGLIFGITGVAVVLVIIVSSLLAFRSLPLLSGMLVGAGGLWTALLVRQMVLICSEPDRAAADACVSPDLIRFAVFAAALVLLGVLLGAGAILRRRSAA